MALPGSFAVNETGAATYSIDIAVPPGTAGMAPTLSLQYSSQGSDGSIGIGWSVSGLPSIGRCARTVAQDGVSGSINYDANDRFCIDGQRLVAVNGAYGANGTEYRTEIDRFTKVVGNGTAGNGPAWFEVRTKAGLIMQLGNSSDSRLLAAGKSSAHAWAVNRIADTAGNYIAVTYINDAVNTQLYPSRIDYTGNAAAGLVPYNSVRFVYASRPDVVSLYQAGSLIKTTQRLTNVHAYVEANLVTDYRLAYNQSSATGRSRLVSITQCDGSSICLPATSLNWQHGTMNQAVVSNVAGQNGTLSGFRPYIADFNGDGLADVLWDAENNSSSSSTGIRTLWSNSGAGTFTVTSNFAGQNGTMTGYTPVIGDFNRDGKSDVWWSDGYFTSTVRWLSTGTGWSSFGAGAGQPPATVYNPGFTADASANARDDVWWDQLFLTYDPGNFPGGGFFLGIWETYLALTNPDGSAGAAQSALQISLFVPESAGQPVAQSYYADFNGDGRLDVLFHVEVGYQGTFVWGPGGDPVPGQQTVFLNSGNGTFPSAVVAGNPWVAGASAYAASKPTFLDLNGDGKIDILWDQVDSTPLGNAWPPGRSSGSRSVWLSKGNGTFSIMDNPGGTNGTLVGYRPLAGDFNGDGKADVLWYQCDSNFASTGARALWQSKGDGTFTVISNFGGLDGTAVGYAPIVADFNGDGKADVMWDSRAGTIVPRGRDDFGGAGTRSTGTRLLWLSDPLAPDLLTGVTTGIGATVAVTYKPLTDSSVYTKDSNATDPLIDLRGPIQVVSRVDASNGIGGTASSTYNYTGAKANLDGRGFLGFRQKVATDLQTGIVATTSYRQDYPYHTQVASETRTLGAFTLSSVVNTYGATGLGGTRYDVYLQQKVESGTDLDGTVLPTLTTTYQYDAYGNATQIVASTSDGLSKTTTHTYVNDTANWRLGRLMAVSVASTNAQGTATRTSSFNYSSSTGLLTQEVIEPSQSVYRVQTDYTLDDFGNTTAVSVSGADITTRTASAVYDARGRFKSSATNAVGHSGTMQYDARSGQPTNQTDANGLTSTWSYDGFGRKLLEVRADGTRAAWTYNYCNGVAGGTTSCPANGAYLVRVSPLASDGVTQIGSIVTSYHDQLGRIIASDSQGFDGSQIRRAVQYDGLGRAAQKSRPYFVSGGTPRWHVFTYDALNRVLTETAPDSSVTQRTYHGLLSTEVNPLSQSVTTVKNSQGQIVSVTDALNQTTAYIYDSFGNLKRVTDAVGNVSAYAYDIRGRKTNSSTPDLGSWTASYNVLGELTSQTDAKGQVTSRSYDLLGRLTQRVEVGLTSTWTYDTALHGIGKVATAATNGGYQRMHVYDVLARPTQLQVLVDAAIYTISTDYDSAGRVAAVTYPSGFAVSSTYNAYGYQTQLKDSATNQALWTANSRDAEGHLTQRTAGNGLVTSWTYNPNTGRLSDLTTGSAGSIQSHAYTYDTGGNMLSRSDANTGLNETFGYDALNRLTSATVGVSVAKTFSYSATGNLLTKSDVGTYSYPAPGQPRPHGVISISGGSLVASFTYDPNGNQTSGAGLTIGYTSFNKPASITRGMATVSIDYDPEHQRFRQVSAAGTTLYLDDNASGVRAERIAGTGGTFRWTNYLFAEGEMVGARTDFSDETFSTQYFHTDNLGSVAVITNEAGAVIERLSYDAWGKRRHPNGNDDPAGGITSQSTRGYTGHEMMSDVALINMNARVYDPMVGRFISADTIVPNPTNGQSWNRYAYVRNNPLKYTDPTGHYETSGRLYVSPYMWYGPGSGGFGGFGGFGWGNNFGFGVRLGAGSANYYSVFAMSSVVNGQAPSGSSWASQYNLYRPSTQTSGDIWLKDAYDPTRDATSGGAGAAVKSSAYDNVDGQMLPPVTVAAPSDRSSARAVALGVAQGVVDGVVPGAHYSGLMQNEFAAGNYGYATIYGVVSLADAFLGIVTLGASTRIQATVRGAARAENLIYRAASGTPPSMTPRSVDTKGLSAADSLANALPGKNQIIDTSKLKNLCAVCDNPATGHVTIAPKDMSQMQGWIDSRGGADIHPLTRELMDAVVGVVRK